MPQDSWPFDVLDREFRRVSLGSRPVCLPGALLGPAATGREVPLLEVRELLLRQVSGNGVRDAVLGELVGRARGGEPWRTAIAGVLLPGLRAVIGPLTRAHAWLGADLESEALAGLFAAVATVRVERGRIAASLIWSARRATDRVLDAELAEVDARTSDEAARFRLRASTSCRDVETGERVDVDPSEVRVTAITSGVRGHAEVVLFDACRARVLTARDVEVIGATRVGGQSLREYAAEVGDVYGNVRVRRFRAERRLRAWLESQVGM